MIALFPELKDKKWAFVDLSKISTNKKFNILNPAEQQKWIDEVHSSLDVDYTYGGYLEHRVKMLAGHYNCKDYFWHLGIDYNVPANTLVTLPVDGELVHSEIDPNYRGGWGGKLIFKINNLFVIFGHLDEIVTEYRKYSKGEIIARIGNYPVNGNWFPHLHLQCCKNFDSKVAGYSSYYEGIESDFPNPLDHFQ